MTVQDESDLCAWLPWDTAFFGARIGRVQPVRLDETRMAAVNAWASAHAIQCLYYLADPDDVPSIRLAEDHGFRFVGTRVTLERELAPGFTPPAARNAIVQVRTVEPADLAALEPIAAMLYRDSRFFVDPRFGESAAQALYVRWLRQSCQTQADVVWVATVGDHPVGYITAHLDRDHVGRIGLAGVGQAAQNAGAGTTLMACLLEWCAAHGVTRVTVVTQGENAGALRFYRRCGFATRSIGRWYHKWFDGTPA